MDIYDHEINKMITAGFFPPEKLYPAVKPNIEYDISKIALFGLDHFKSKSEEFDALFWFFKMQVELIDALQKPEAYIHPFNFIINTTHSEDYLSIHGSFPIAKDLIPVVTGLDKILWYGIYAFYQEQMINLGASEYDPPTLMFTWIYLLLLVQEKEYKNGYTIDLDSLKNVSDILTILLKDFNDSSVNPHLRKLTHNESLELSSLFNKRQELTTMIHEERARDKALRKRTKKEWETFLNIINDLSESEKHVIQVITSNTSARDKVKAIKYYNTKISDIERGKYYLNGKQLNLLNLYEVVCERMQSCSACAKTTGGYPFVLSSAIFDLAMSPHTYNSVFIVFHLFRLEPNVTNATRFISLALECINRNLDQEHNTPDKLEEMIKAFHSTVMTFINSNREYIDQLCFESLQPNAVIVNSSLFNVQTETDSFYDTINSKTKKITDAGKIEEEVAKLFESNVDKQQITTQIAQFEAECEKAERIAKARRIILSVNIIYLFCDALRMVLSNNIVVEFNKRIEIANIRSKLSKIESQLIHKVYNIKDDELDILEYREKTGIVYSTLSEHEVQMEQLRNATFSSILKSTVEEFASIIEAKDTEGILQIKAKIKKEISCYPDCDDKLHYAEWLDSISDRISKALISICKIAEDDYLEIKCRITSSLGEKCSILPSSAIDSLTTAEMLFQRYAKEEYANKGFDYSCISALYYQAFEDAYNELIWAKYASHLNSLTISGSNYTDILKRHKNSRAASITETDARGYLFDDDLKQRNYYVLYHSGTASVNTRCMYKSFAIIMEQLKNPSDLNGFCEFVAKLCGFAGMADMFSDTAFMQKCHDFSDEISRSANNRNNASHGGSFISLGQCTDDKKTILNNLESIRCESVGLIQQLLYILQKD